MGADVQLNLLIKRHFLWLTACILMLGCTQSATTLPPDYGSLNSSEAISSSQFGQSDLSLSCEEIYDSIVVLRQQREALRQEITANREQDQAIGFFAALVFTPLMLTMDNDEDEKNFLDRIQTRIDTLTSLRRFKFCPPNIS